MSLSPEPRLAEAIRPAGADEARVAAFNVDLRTGPAFPPDLVERARQVGHAAGYAEGWSQGQQAAHAAAVAVRDQMAAAHQMNELARTTALNRGTAALAAAANELDRRRTAEGAALDQLVLDTAVQLAEALLGRELSTGTAGVDALRRAMAAVPPSGTVTVRLNPLDYQALTGTDGPVTESVYEGRPVLLRADPRMGTGDALAECGTSTVDARLSTAFERVRAALR